MRLTRRDLFCTCFLTLFACAQLLAGSVPHLPSATQPIPDPSPQIQVPELTEGQIEDGLISPCPAMEGLFGETNRARISPEASSFPESRSGLRATGVAKGEAAVIHQKKHKRRKYKLRRQRKQSERVGPRPGPPRKSKWAKKSLTFGLVSFALWFLFPLLSIPASILAIVFGTRSLSERETKRRKAVAGIVLGSLNLLLIFSLVTTALIIFVF
ncbi:MAG: DUF4190 domain-containing protein [Bacteroidota bacterium]